MRPILALLLVAPAAWAQTADQAADQTFAAICTWLRVAPEGFYDGPCEVTWTGDGARVVAGTSEWTIVERGRQGQWSAVTLNGQDAMRFEVDRTRHSHATRDLNEVLDVQGP